jgi:hypothetical protein
MPQAVSIPGSPIVAGQIASVGTTAVGLYTAVSGANATAGIPCLSVIIQNDSGSAAAILVGDVNGQYIKLAAGANPLQLPCSNLNQVYVKTSSSTATVNLIWMSPVS